MKIWFMIVFVQHCIMNIVCYITQCSQFNPVEIIAGSSDSDIVFDMCFIGLCCCQDLYVEVKCSTPSQWKDHELDVVTHRLPVNCHEKMLLKRANIGGSLIYELNDIKKQLRSKGGQWSYEVRHDNSGNCEGHGLHYSIRH